MEDLELYNSKFKVYPDGLIVDTYADKPKFRLPTDEKKKKQKVDMSFLNWSYSTFLFSSITYDNGYIYIDSATGEQLYVSRITNKTQVEIAEAVGVSRSTLLRWINGQGKPSGAQLADLPCSVRFPLISCPAEKFTEAP